MSVKFNTIVPSTFVPKPLTSGSQHVIRRRKVEILPVSQTTYQYSGNNRIQFNIQSASEFLDCQNSFLRFELRAYGISATGTDDPFLALATGGAHALIKQAIVRLQNGTEIMRIDDYNKWYAMMSNLTQSAEHVDRYGWMYGDSVGRYKQFDPKRVRPQVTAAYTVAGLQFSGNVEGGAATLTSRTLPLIPENMKLTLDVDDAADPASIADSVIDPLTGGANSARVEACNNASNNSALSETGRILSCNLPLSIFQLHQFLPLPFIQGGLQLELVLEDPVRALCLNEYVAADGSLPTTPAVDYSIVTPRYVCQMVQPSEEIMSKYLMKYKEGTLTYPYLKTQHYLNTNNGSNGTFSFVMHPNMRSAVLASTIVQNLNANTSGKTANSYDNGYVYDAIGTTIKAKINSYQYKVGSDNFPDIAVSMPDTYNSEAFAESQRAFGHLGSVLFAPRSQPRDWWSTNTDSGETDESIRMVMAYDLSRDSSIFSGIDVSVAPFTAEFGTSAAYQLNSTNATRYCHTYVVGNAILKISQAGVSVLN